MFTSVTHTGTYYQGCSHGCGWCFSQFMPVPISHAPRLMQNDEYQLLTEREAVIFLQSAHDSFSDCIPQEWILAMLRWIGRQHESLEFYLQTQNVLRATAFMPELLEVKHKIILGTTIQTDDENIIKTFTKAPTIYSRYKGMKALRAEGFRLRLSLEPLFRFNPGKMEEMVLNINPEIVHVGLDNYGHRHNLDVPRPFRTDYLVLRGSMLDAGIKVIEKRSMKKWLNP